MTQATHADLPLQVKIEGEQIVIRIGLNVLKVVAEHCPLLSEDGEATAPPYAKVVDNRQLAKDVIHELDQATAELTKSQQKLAALTVDPAQREELVANSFEEFRKHSLTDGAEVEWQYWSKGLQQSFAATVEYAFFAGRLSRDAEVAELQRQLASIESEYGEHKSAIRAAGLAAVYFGKDLKIVNTIDGKAGEHGTNCGYFDSESECTCGLEWRKALQTEREMHNAWRKRAEDAEQQLSSLAEPKDVEALARIYLDAARKDDALVYEFDHLPLKHRKCLLSGILAVAAHIRAESAQQIADQARRIDTLVSQVETAEAALDKLAAAKGDKLTVAGESIAMGDALVSWALGQIADLTEKLEKMIDPRAIYDTFSCPCCKGSKTVSPFCPDSGKCEEEKCDFCDGDGFVAFAHLADRHSRLMAKLEEREAYIRSKESRYQCFYCGDIWSTEDAEDGRRLSLEHNDRCEKNPRRQVEADRDQWKQRAETAEKDLRLAGQCVTTWRDVRDGIQADRDRLAAELATEKKNHQATAELLGVVSQEAKATKQALAAKAGELQRLRAILKDADRRLWLHHNVSRKPELAGECGICAGTEEQCEGNIFVAIEAAIATPAAAEPEPPAKSDCVYRVKWADSTGMHTSSEIFESEAAAHAWAMNSLSMHDVVSWSVQRCVPNVAVCDRQAVNPPAAAEPTRPRIVCLCGSTRFMKAFQQANLKETLAGRIVLSVGCDTKADGDLFKGDDAEENKRRLDVLHKRKIDLSDEVLVLDVGGYIGESTRSEIEHATKSGKPIRYLSKEQPAAAEPAQADIPSLPSQEENPHGLYSRYIVTKANGEPCDPRAIYFVLRLDGFGDDSGHIRASRLAALAYADAIDDIGAMHLMRVATELRSLIKKQPIPEPTLIDSKFAAADESGNGNHGTFHNVTILGKHRSWRFDGNTAYIELPFALTAEEVKEIYSFVVKHPPAADHSGDANKKVEPSEPPAFVCPACGGSHYGVTAYDIFCGCRGCNWRGTWAGVAEASGDDLTLASIKRHGAEQRDVFAARGKAGEHPEIVGKVWYVYCFKTIHGAKPAHVYSDKETLPDYDHQNEVVIPVVHKAAFDAERQRSNDLQRRLNEAEAGAAAIKAEIKSRLIQVEEMVAKGKGTWPEKSYVRDDTWARWQGELLVLRSLNDKTLSTTAGAATAERLRRAEICIGDVRDAQSMYWVERALAKYDQSQAALATLDQPQAESQQQEPPRD